MAGFARTGGISSAPIPANRTTHGPIEPKGGDVTEREYVEAIRDVATKYRDIFRKDRFCPSDKARIDHWEAIKQKLCPSTAIALCNAWLAANPQKGGEDAA